jgi:hypothetical protein
MRAAWKVEAKDGMARTRRLAEWLEREYPSAAASLREGLEECFTINRLGVPPSLQRCLATTNIIESPHAGVRIRTRCLTNWLDGPAMDRLDLRLNIGRTSQCAASLPLRQRRNRPDFSTTQHCRKLTDLLLRPQHEVDRSRHTRLTISRIKQIGVGCGGQGSRPGFTLARNG